MIWSLIESGHGFIRNINAHTDINYLINSFLFTSKLSEKSIKFDNDLVPSFMFSSEVSFGLGQIFCSLFSESLSIGNVFDALFEGGCVFNNSLSGIINGSLRDSHEGGESANLVIFFLESEGDTLNQFRSNFIKSSTKLGKHVRISEISQFKESFDNWAKFSLREFLFNFLEGFLDFGDLDKRGSSWSIKSG